MSAYSDWKAGALSDGEYRASLRYEAWLEAFRERRREKENDEHSFDADEEEYSGTPAGVDADEMP